mgnify:CR=1 FL=1
MMILLQLRKYSVYFYQILNVLFLYRETKETSSGNLCSTVSVISETVPSEGISCVTSNDKDNFYRVKDMERRNTLCKILKLDKANILEMWVTLVKDISYCSSGIEVGISFLKFVALVLEY